MNFWDTASAIFRAMLLMSLSGSIVAGLLFMIKPLVRNTMSKSAQYYLWMIAIASYLLPVSVFVTLPVGTPLAPVQQLIETNVNQTNNGANRSHRKYTVNRMKAWIFQSR